MDKPTLFISISSTDEDYPHSLIYNVQSKQSYICLLQFDDIEPHFTLIDDSAVQKIINSVIKYKEQIIVHCDAGYSATAAIFIWLNKEDNEFFRINTALIYMYIEKFLTASRIKTTFENF